MTCATSPEKAAETAHQTTACQAIFLHFRPFYLTPAQLPTNKTLTRMWIQGNYTLYADVCAFKTQNGPIQSISAANLAARQTQSSRGNLLVIGHVE